MYVEDDDSFQDEEAEDESDIAAMEYLVTGQDLNILGCLVELEEFKGFTLTKLAHQLHTDRGFQAMD